MESILQSRKEMDSQLPPNSYVVDTPTYFPRPGERERVPSGATPPRGRGSKRGGRGGYRGGRGGRPRDFQSGYVYCSMLGHYCNVKLTEISACTTYSESLL